MLNSAQQNNGKKKKANASIKETASINKPVCVVRVDGSIVKASPLISNKIQVANINGTVSTF